MPTHHYTQKHDPKELVALTPDQTYNIYSDLKNRLRYTKHTDEQFAIRMHRSLFPEGKYYSPEQLSTIVQGNFGKHKSESSLVRLAIMGKLQLTFTVLVAAAGVHNFKRGIAAEFNSIDELTRLAQEYNFPICFDSTKIEQNFAQFETQIAAIVAQEHADRESVRTLSRNMLHMLTQGSASTSTSSSCASSPCHTPVPSPSVTPFSTPPDTPQQGAYTPGPNRCTSAATTASWADHDIAAYADLSFQPFDHLPDRSTTGTATGSESGSEYSSRIHSRSPARRPIAQITGGAAASAMFGSVLQRAVASCDEAAAAPTKVSRVARMSSQELSSMDSALDYDSEDAPSEEARSIADAPRPTSRP
jgi:hypothetical protein